MFNYIKAEFYRNFSRAQLWVFSGVIAAMALTLNILMSVAGNANSIDLGWLFEMMTQMLIVPIFLVATFIDITTAEESKNLTLKNAVSFGVSRSKIALSKVIVTVGLSFVSAFIIFTVFFGSGAIIFGTGEGSLPIIANASLRILAAIPLWIGAISVGTFIALFISNSTAAAFVYAGAFTVTSGIVNLLTILVSDKFNYISDILITTQLANLKQPSVGNEILNKAIVIGIVYTILFTILSMLYIKKKEIK
ncbi:MAG: putative type transport system permease protein [Clostridiales bacterium]|jgi:ABC-2 type transport system permease protein|nr:putative type transport system permease protein [Clostridiales bacterium]